MPALPTAPGSPTALTSIKQRCRRRLGSVALVSKRFRGLCLAPPLVRKVSFVRSIIRPIHVRSNEDARLRSLCNWLVSTSPPIVNLSLRCDLTKALHALLVDSLTVLCAAAPLQQLAVCYVSGDLELPLSLAAWLQPAHATLRQLDLKPLYARLAIDAPLQQFTALSKMAVHCDSLKFEAGCWLPSSLTYLSLGGFKEGLPSQVRAEQ